MNKRLVGFGAGAVVIAAALIFALGVYPPASKREAQGAIGQRNVYRDPQVHDAAVTPGAAPVAASTLNPAQIKAVNEVSAKLAADFAMNVQTGLKAELDSKLIGLLARPEMAAEYSRNFTAEFARDMQQQVLVSLQADLTQAVLAGSLKGDLSQALASEVSSQMVQQVATQFARDAAPQFANQLAQYIKADVAQNVASQAAANLSSQFAGQMASQFSSSVAMNLTSGFVLN